MARGQRSNGSRRPQRNGRVRHLDNDGIIPVLARAVREVETAVQRGSALVGVRPRFQAIALLVRDERFRVKADTSATEAYRSEQLKRLDGVATILAQTAARQPSLFTLLDEDAEITSETKALRREMLQAGGVELPEPEAVPETEVAGTQPDRGVVPVSVSARQLANPFLKPDFSVVRRSQSSTHRLSGWELLGPLFRSFENAEAGASACMPLPEDVSRAVVGSDRRGQELMLHQAQVVAAAGQGHRTFLLADEPGLGKTAQALLAAQAAKAFPLLVVVPNVVKTNWAAEAARWVPRHAATVVHGDGREVDGFADIVVVNYEVLDRHAGWMADHGFRGMVVDEAHFIKNRSSQRSQHVLRLSQRIRARVGNPLLMALTGTPLINDIEDFRAIWQFLGWIDDKAPLPALMDSLEEIGLTPADLGFYPAARQRVVDMGIVRRRKVDVAADIPARRVADLTVELDDEAGRSIKKAEKELARRLVERYDTALATRTSGSTVVGIDHELVRRVATWEREDSTSKTGENVFGMMRRIGQAKAGLAADYAAQLARSTGKVVFFAKHVDVMDDAEELFASRGIGYTSIRGDQSRAAREKAITSFTSDPEVEVVVCSLTAAGVGLNLQVASNLVLAELSWTDAEQTQAIDRVHRIGQTMPVTAWRVIAAQTIDARIAELIDSKAGLAARALDGAGEDASSTADVQLEALVSLLTDALRKRRR
ncbi:RNA polymerase-associated protein RapA [Nocardioides aquaticus]|uniref:RNA polymerase-associated protein RapA n=1 Tax=Nocardioides aquaticus TaxID=160826 RepID=A0ABX8ELA9_9ACTN|nr:DEAD/DEAH box helicase [Nocardioides aquaticus]QVT79398.1 RNA polymerase-associated protein RapA [Nocardioides aquaticus]